VGAGKTETALNALTEVLQRQRFARVWVLLATRRQQDAFRQRLIELDDGRNLYFNVDATSGAAAALAAGSVDAGSPGDDARDASGAPASERFMVRG
jgi:hypothetical protein